MKKNEHSIREYLVPMTYQAENALLGALISEPSAIGDVRKAVCETSFSDPANADVWRVLADKDATGAEITLETVYPLVDGSHFQRNIMPYLGTIGYHDIFKRASELAELAAKRTIYFAAVTVLQDVTGSASAGAAIEKLAEVVTDLRGRTTDDGVRHISQVNNELGDVLQKRQLDREAGKRNRIPTGFNRLDWLTYGGFAPGNLVILAARPSVGKTAFMLQMARTSATAGVPSMVFSLEMTNAELAQRMVSSTGMISSRDLAAGAIDWTAFEEATGKFANAPLWFTDRAFRLDEIVNKIATMHKQKKCDIAFIDYLGLIDQDDNKTLREQVTYCTKRLKRLAKECEIPIVLLCQLNRDMSKEGREPQMHDLRESGSIEQDADIIVMLSRSREQDSRTVTMFVRKNRQGELGQADYYGDNGYTTFNEIAFSNTTTTVPEDAYYNRD